MQRRIAVEGANAKAAAVSMPGPVRDAFAGDPRTACGLTIFPLTCGLEAILKRIDSPITRIFELVAVRAHEIRADAQAGGLSGAALESSVRERLNGEIIAEVKPTTEQLIDTVFCFTRPRPEVSSLLRVDRQKLSDAAMAAIGDRFSPPQLSALFSACCEEYASAFTTALSYESAQAESTGAVTFPTPPTTTGLVGGSTLTPA
jgi:hypothetical protein